MLNNLNKYFSLFLFTSLVFSTHAFGQTDPKSWIIQKMEIHSPNSIYLLRAYDRLPRTLSIQRGGSTMSTTRSTDAFYYLQTGSRESALSSMGINVHEIGHGYGGVLHFDELMRCNCDQSISFSDIQKGFYQTPQEQFWIEIESDYIFPSAQLRNTIPSNLITFRFQTYITGNSSPGVTATPIFWRKKSGTCLLGLFPTTTPTNSCCSFLSSAAKESACVRCPLPSP